MRSGPTVDPFTWKYGGSTFFSLFIAKPDHMQMTTCILSILRYTKPSRSPLFHLSFEAHLLFSTTKISL